MSADNTARKMETPEEQLQRVLRENAALKAQVERKSTLTCKIGMKGGLSVYGMGRFPVTLYVEQWERLFAFVDDIKLFIGANRSALKLKGE